MTSSQSRLFYWMLRFTKHQSPLRTNLSLEEQRLRLQNIAQSYVRYFPSNVEKQAISLGELNAEWLHPANARGDRAILYLHGGAFTMGSMLDGRNLAALIALACQSPARRVGFVAA